jgi:diacylglycerol kinase (ATP)
VALIVNPTSGKGRGARSGSVAAARLRELGVGVHELTSRDAAHVRELADRAVTEGHDAVVAVGGDGMVHLVLQALAGTGRPFGIVPAGSGNDFARLLGIAPHDPVAAADVIAAEHVRELDAGRVGEQWFASVLSSGFDSNVNERGNAMTWPRGAMRYNLAILAELRVFRPMPFRIVLDDAVVETEAMLVAVGNGVSYGGGMKVCPDASPDDGLLDVTVLGPLGKVEFLRVFPSVYKGTHVQHPAVSQYRSRSVRLETPLAVAYADGEYLAPLPVDVTCVAGAVQVLVPG